MHHYFEVAPNQIIRSKADYFTYHYDSDLSVGQIVLIEVGSKKMPGVILKKTKEKPQYETKAILSIIEEKPLPKPLVDLIIWISKYYTSPMANVIQTVLPSGILKNRREIKEALSLNNCRERTNIVLNDEQVSAVKKILSSDNKTHLLYGVTGSGKTEVYINVVAEQLKKGLSSIILVPEISLTPQLVSEFQNHFTNIVVTHSKMTEAARHVAWKKVLNSKTPQIIIGPRSALFMPVEKLGVIIIDECHEPSFKQEHSPRYSALRAASMLGKYHNAKVLFGSATPSIVDKYLADQSSGSIIKLTKLARKNSLPPEVKIVDMTDRKNLTQHRFLSDSLLEQVKVSLKNHSQILIFHNRRGGASSTFCENCGWSAECPNCFLPMTLHIGQYVLKCHTCGLSQKVPTSCPVCHQSQIIHKGIGTQLIEKEIERLFPEAKVARFDSDSEKNASLDKLYDQIYAGEIDIIIGTQVVAKGLDLPKLQLVGVIQADAGLAIPDFAASERVFQLLDQVVGRVGRNEKSSQVIIQTYKTKHPSIEYGARQNYEKFYDFTIEERRRGKFPPFTYLLKLTNLYQSEVNAIKSASKLANELRKDFPEVEILGPAPAFYERRGKNYCWQLIVKSKKRETLIKISNQVKGPNWQQEIDPTSLV